MGKFFNTLGYLKNVHIKKDSERSNDLITMSSICILFGLLLLFSFNVTWSLCLLTGP